MKSEKIVKRILKCSAKSLVMAVFFSFLTKEEIFSIISVNMQTFNKNSNIIHVNI